VAGNNLQEKNGMSKITRLEVTIQTGNRERAGTDGDVYLAIAGREFNLDSERDDFERGHVDEFLLGEEYQPGQGHAGFKQVRNRAENDPRQPQLDLADVDKFPVWIRLSPAGAYPGWLLESVDVKITIDSEPAPLSSWIYVAILDGGLWLGKDSGLFCFLKKREQH
jgi:PLAT/LH2 domain-containing protein